MTVQVFKDIEKKCVICGIPFIWRARDQQFYSDMVRRGIWKQATEPRKCRICKGIEKKRQESESHEIQ